MRFDCSVVKNFRNCPELKINWDPGINLILGRNGSGKTNLLESLSILTGWGAFGRTRNVISWTSEKLHASSLRASIGAEVSGEERFNITAEISSKVSMRLDNKAISFTDLRLKFPSIIFLTSNINLIDGSPSARRLFIDRLCSLFFPIYAKRLADFKYIMRTRTLLLRQGKSPARTEIPFCELGGWIMDKRREVILQLMSLIDREKITLSFIPSLTIPQTKKNSLASLQTSSQNITEELSCEFSGQEYLHNFLQANSKRELYAQRPLCGPNYDDLAIIISENGRSASEALSRGQKRRLILYMIITAGKLIAAKLKRNPVLLFDDLTAELDAEGREWTYTQLAKTKWQIFITAPEKPFKTRKKFGGITLSLV
ncbi:MAG: DNA replication/repair protein RecF [Synergistaceae bacterium]|nr:DNA replication/repair protein RecF [Synergistaceae bacterium]